MTTEQEQPTNSEIKKQLDHIESLIRRSHRIGYWQAVAIAGVPVFGIGLANFLHYLPVFSWDHFATLVIGGLLVLYGWTEGKKLKNNSEIIDKLDAIITAVQNIR